jgi:hypothetical protein
MLPFQGEERKGQHPFWKEKKACEAALDSHAKGQPEDEVARRCEVVGGRQSRAVSGLIRSGRQLVGPVGPKGCLGRYCCGDQTDCQNKMD